jgi:hypothetical protein
MRSITGWKIDARKVICTEKGDKKKKLKEDEEEETFSNDSLCSSYIMTRVTLKCRSNQYFHLHGVK